MTDQPFESPKLPSPEEVKATMCEVSDKVDAFDKHLAQLAKEYGVHGDPVRAGEYEFQITRQREGWGVFYTHREGGPLESVTGAKQDVKLEFLGVVEKMEPLYRRRIMKIFNMAKDLLDKHK